MKIYFNDKDQLYFDGYDCGKRVDDVWGDSDDEYNYLIEPAEVQKFYPLFGLQDGDKSALLQEIKTRFGVNKAYTLLGEFMQLHNIAFSRFSYT